MKLSNNMLHYLSKNICNLNTRMIIKRYWLGFMFCSFWPLFGERMVLNLRRELIRLNAKKLSDRSNNIYTPRPFFEVEITIGSDDLPGIRRYLRNQKDPEEFDAVTDLGTTFKVKFKRKTSRKNDPRTLHSTGIDFMSSGREDGGRKLLGQYMKGKLMQNGLLNFGDPVTDDVLIEYGKFHLDLYFIGNGCILCNVNYRKSTFYLDVCSAVTR